MGLYGRRILYSDHDNITADNLEEVLRGIFSDYQANRAEIAKLYDIYTGKTDILMKDKEVRPEINHKVCENRAYEVVNFFTGYTFGEPVQYVHSGECKADDTALQSLNRHMALCGKDACDSAMADWLFICGIAFRLVLAGREDTPEEAIRVLCADARDTFVIRSTSIDHHVVMGGTCVFSADGREQTWTLYTKDLKFDVHTGVEASLGMTVAGDITVEENVLGAIPIIEYEANTARMGAFEPVVDLLNALNELQSNRLDDVVQTVNSFLALLGCQIDEKTYQELAEKKMLFLPEGTDAKYLTCPLDQSGMQSLKEDIYQSILTICGMPNRNGGTSTSDTGSAVILRDGWESAEARAQTVEKRFRPPEYAFLALALNILGKQDGLSGLKATDVEVKFNRRNYANIQTKSQVLTGMLSNENIHPETAFVSCGMFVDPIAEYQKGQKWREEQEKKADERAAEAREMSDMQETADGSVSGDDGEGEVPQVQKDDDRDDRA